MPSFLADAGREGYAHVVVKNSLLKKLADYDEGYYATLVPKQGVGKVVYPTSISLQLHAGSSALTDNTDLYIQHINDDGTIDAANIVNPIETDGFITMTTDYVTFASLQHNRRDVARYWENKNLALCILSETNLGGNAENDARLSVELTYRVHRIISAYT